MTPNSPDEAWGDTATTKPENHIRFFFQNVNGLPSRQQQRSILTKIGPLHDLQTDIIGLAETNLEFNNANNRYATSNAFRQLFDRSTNVSTTTSAVPFKRAYKPGGTLTAAVGKWCSRIESSGEDPYKLGRWSYTIFRAKNEQRIAVMTAYRVCQNAQAKTDGTLKTYTQQRTLLRQLIPTNDDPDPNPKQYWDRHFSEQLTKWKQLDYQIIVMLDANETLPATSTTHLHRIFRDHQMIDAFSARHPHLEPRQTNDPIITYQRGRRRLDYIMISRSLEPFVLRSGYLSYADCPHSDHRGIFVDFDAPRLFGSLQPILPHTMRALTTKHPAKVQSYLTALRQYFEQHNIEQRSQDAFVEAAACTPDSWTPAQQANYNSIDRDITRGMLHAEQKCGGITHKRKWSPAFENAGLACRYWGIRARQLRDSLDMTASLTILRSKTHIEDNGSDAEEYILEQLSAARKTFQKVIKSEDTLRETHLDTLAAQEAARHHHKHEHTIKRIKAAERHKKIFQKINYVLGRGQQGSLQRLKVPSQSLDPTTQLPHPGVDSYPLTSATWETVQSPQLVEAHLIARNNTHYRQANPTPFGNTDRGRRLGFHGTNDVADSILNGTYTDNLNELNREEKAYVNALQHPQSHIIPDQRDMICTHISTSDMVDGFGKWPEKTSTSPSGLHLGHYRCLLYDRDDKGNYPLFSVIENMINIPLLTGQSPDRWLTASSVCIEKEANNPQTDKIRIIHLFEADLNLVWKLVWGSRLVQSAELNNLYPDAQYGSRPSRNAIDAVLAKTLRYEFSRVARVNMALMDNDAKANFDRIVCNISSIACQRLGMPKRAEQCHNDTLLRLIYNVKTGYGTSADTYGSIPGNPMQGQGQGSGNAPSCWGAVSTPMWSALAEISPTAFTSSSVDQSTINVSHGVAYVDDATVFLNDMGPHPMDETTLATCLQHKAQTWERLLYTNGGALQLPKCFCYIMHWDWALGFPILRSKNKMTNHISIIDSPSQQPVTITMKGYGEAERTLGVRIAPNGMQTTEIKWLTDKALSFASKIRQGYLSREEALTAYQSVFIPRMTFSLGATTLSPTEAKKLQSEALMSILPSLGINRNMKRNAVFGPATHGGHNIKCLYTEQGIQQLENLLGHLRLQSSIGALITATLSMHQLTAGISHHILERPDITLPHLEPGWITSIRSFLVHIQATIQINKGLLSLSPARQNDQLLMETFSCDPTLGSAAMHKLNHCRLFLQATTLSDICNGAGTEILREALIGTDSLPGSSSTWLWPRQPSPPSTSWSLWRKALRKHFLTPGKRSYTLKPDSCMGAWLPSLKQHHRQWTHLVDPSTGTVWQRHHTQPPAYKAYYPVRPHTKFEFRVENTNSPPMEHPSASAIPATTILSTSYMTMYSAFTEGTIPHISDTTQAASEPNPAFFLDHLQATLPHWERRLLYELHESADLLRDISEQHSLVLASDGSLEGSSGCFGWVIGTESHISWTGSGPVDGSPWCMSSQRTELCGMLSALRFLLNFFSYHRCQLTNSSVTLVCDSRSALQFAALPHLSHSAIQANHPDYDLATEIHSTLRQLPFHVKLKWIKGHQDRDKPYDSLSREAQLNVHADAAAGTFQHECPSHARSKQQGSPSMPSCHSRLFITGHLISGSHKQLIREASLLPALRTYIVQRNSWQPATWSLVDWTSHGRCLATYSSSQRLTLTKFLHRWLPVNHQLAKMNPANPTACGACNEPNETDDHVCRCPHPEAQSIRSQARANLHKALDACGTDPTLRTLLSYGIGEWQDTATREVEMEPPAEHPFADELRQAISEQNLIGWDQILRGRLAHSWGTCYISWLAHVPSSRPIKKLSHTAWTTLIIKWAWDLVLSLWQHRNTLAHDATTEETTNALHLRAQLQVRDRYAKSTLLSNDYPADVAFYFSQPLETFVLKATHILDTWTKQVDRIFTKHRKEINQRIRRGQLTHFFPRRPRSPNRSTQTPL
jgi:hypothetical protein